MTIVTFKKETLLIRRNDRMKFVLLFLLLFWNHARGHWLRCNTGMVITNQAISLSSSIHAGAKVSFIQEFTAPSLIYCLEECCSGKYGACSVVEYKSNSTDVNCIYYSCQPIPKCKFMDSEGTDSFTFPAVTKDANSTYNTVHNNGKNRDKLKEQSVTKSTMLNQQKQTTFKTHERAVAARKGVDATIAANEDNLLSREVFTTGFENRESLKSSYSSKDQTHTVNTIQGVSTISNSPNIESSASLGRLSTENMENGGYLKSSDTVTIEDILSKTDSSFKNDNTTIKPRKGVDFEGELVTAKIKARKGVEATHPLQDINGPQITRSKVKPRKGVSALLLSSTAELDTNTKASSEFAPKSDSFTDVATYVNSMNFNRTSSSYVPQSSDLISALEQVFRDESDSSEADFKFFHSPHSIATSTSNIFSVSSSPVSSVKYHEYSTVPLYSSATKQNSVSMLSESTTMPFHSISPSRSSTHQEMIVESTPPLTSVTEYVKLHSESPSPGSIEMLSRSRIPVLKTSRSGEYSVSRVESTHHYDTSVLLFTVSSPNKTKKPLASIEDDTENERKYKSSMHLVLSLVFGLLVLFVVLGAVAKRVYDVWMRRHYHRMDFLIDGMYDGFS